MKTSARFELAVTLIALASLVIFWFAAVPNFSWGTCRYAAERHRRHHGCGDLRHLVLPGDGRRRDGGRGKMIHPQKDIPMGFLSRVAAR